MEQKVCIAMVPCPGLSHLIPLVEFAKQLVLHHKNFHVKFLIPTLGSPTPSTISILNSLPPNIDFTFLPQIKIQDLPPNIHLSTQMKLTVKYSLHSLHQAISTILTSSQSKNNFVALVFDIFSSDVIDIAKKFNLLSYFFVTGSVISLQFCLNLPKLDEAVSLEFMDTTKTFDIPNSKVSFKVKDFPDPVLFARSSETYKDFLLLCQRFSMVDGIIINSFKDMELDATKSMEDFTNIYPVGPIIQKESKSKQNESKCITWLNKKPQKSVLFISFGSGGTLTNEQIKEIAFGLELSGCNFLWVLRVPSKHSSSAYFSGSSQQKGNHNFDDDPLNYLPLGFLERTKNQGLVVPSWAPQVEILSHGSTGGFLTHCGWGSSLEGLVYGVPMICWPLFAEQRMNAATLTDVFKVGVRPKIDDEDGIIKGEEVARVIKIIMDQNSMDCEGLLLRRRIEELRVEAAHAVSEDGSSRKALSSLVVKWEERVITQKLKLKCFSHIY